MDVTAITTAIQGGLIAVVEIGGAVLGVIVAYKIWGWMFATVDEGYAHEREYNDDDEPDELDNDTAGDNEKTCPSCGMNTVDDFDAFADEDSGAFNADFCPQCNVAMEA